VEQGFGIDDILAVIRRRWLWMIPPVLLGVPLAFLIALALPPTYVATGRMLVESQQIPESLARSTVTTGAVERVRLIEQRLMTRANMLDIAKRFDVYASRPDLSPTQIYHRMLAATSIDDIVLATQNRGEVTASAVQISFRAGDPQLAARVANELVTQVLNQNLRDRNARASSTLAFFTSEVQRLSRELNAVEAEITAIKAGNQDALPASIDFRRGEFARLQERIFERETLIASFEEQLRALDAAVESGLTVGGAPASPERAELDRLRQALAQQLALYADTHPAVRQTRARIAALETTLAATADAGPEEESAAGPATPPQIAIQREGLVKQIALQGEQLVRDRERLARLGDSIERTPGIEIDLGRLERTRDSIQSQYEQALAKQAEAATGERLEVNQQAERFELIEQPEAPSAPASPNRPLIVLAGAGASMAVGAALMLLVELLNIRIHNSRDLERRLKLRPIVSIPYVSTERELRVGRWQRRAAVFAVLIGFPAGLYAVDTFYRPLPLIAERVMDRTGLRGIVIGLERRLGV
jgi:uncharacterized protein involved in exopolysaccharide biosynthesis